MHSLRLPQSIFGTTKLDWVLKAHPTCHKPALNFCRSSFVAVFSSLVGLFLRIIRANSVNQEYRKNPHAHKNKIGTSPPPSKKNHDPPPPPKRRNFMGAHKIGAHFPGPRIAGRKITDMRLCLRIILANLFA